jgi:outer membrane receptor protein involved in Fe transport
MPIRKPLWTGWSILSGLGVAVVLLSAPPTGADDLVRIAQAEDAGAGADQAEPPATAGPAGVEEIIVKGAETQAAADFKAADSVTSFSTADLVALGAANIADLAAFTPNLEIVTSGATTPTFFIRGVGLNDFGANSSGSVAIYQDDVALSSQAIQLGTVFDMENIVVLRGPQGTGLARNASAGAIKLYTRKPTGQFNGYLRGEAGNFDHRDYEGAIEAPIWEDLLSGRFAFRLSERDGTMKNRCAGAPVERAATRFNSDLPPFSICSETVQGATTQPPAPPTAIGVSDIPVGLPKWMNDRDNWAARGTLRFEPTLETSFLLGAHGARRDELSRVGQSYGTSGFTCTDVSNCQSLAAGREQGTLGGRQNFDGYMTPEVRRRLTELAPCFTEVDAAVNCGSPPNPGVPANPDFVAYNNALRRVARELARNLDDEPWEGDFNYAGNTTNDTWGAALKGEILLPWDLELTTVGGYDHYDRSIAIDLDFSPETLFHIFTLDEGKQLYQDVKLAGEHELIEDSPIRWDIGGWVLQEQLDVNVIADLGRLSFFGVGEREYTQELLNVAGYGSFAFDFWDDFTLDGGVRYNYEEKDIDYLLTQLGGLQPTPLNEHDVWREPTGTLRLTYRFREDTHVYWKYTHGWKPGHYNATGSLITGISTAEPETIDAFETGLRAEWFDGFLSGDASLFYYDYANYQIFIAQQYAGGGPEFVILNANNAEVYGAEIDALVRPWAGGFLNVRFAWLETQFLDFLQLQQERVQVSGLQSIVNRELQNTGNPLLNSPQFKVSFTAEQAIPLGRYGYLIPRYDGVWTDDSFYDSTGGRGLPNNQNVQYLPEFTIAQRAYWLHNLRLAYRTPDGRLEIAGWVRNLEDKAYKTFAFDGSTFLKTSIYFVGDPRTYGVTATVTF